VENFYDFAFEKEKINNKNNRKSEIKVHFCAEHLHIYIYTFLMGEKLV
jgi:hypothetical protein